MRSRVFFTVAVFALSIAAGAAFAQSFNLPLSGVGRDVMNANPFLRSGVGDMPPLTTTMVSSLASGRHPHEVWQEPIESVYLGACPVGIRPHLGLARDRKPLCVHVVAHGAMHAYEENYTHLRKFAAPLYENSPQIQRVYEFDIDPKLVRRTDADRRCTGLRQIANVDRKGHVTPVSVLIKVSDTGDVATEIPAAP